MSLLHLYHYHQFDYRLGIQIVGLYGGVILQQSNQDSFRYVGSAVPCSSSFCPGLTIGIHTPNSYPRQSTISDHPKNVANLMKSYYLSFNSDHGMSWVPCTQNTMAQHLPTTGLASPSGRPPNPSEAKGKIPMPESSRGGRVVRVRVRHRKSWWRFCFNEMNPNDVSTSEYLWNIRYVLGPLCLIMMLMWRRYGCVYCTMKYDR